MLESTPVLLVTTAERLYARAGIKQVSLRQIAEAAGQRNPAAVQYHFGSKIELLRAILRFRIGPYSDWQLRHYRILEAEGRALDVRGLVQLALEPFALLPAGDSSFVAFLAELIHNPEDFMEVWEGIDAELLAGPALLWASLVEALQDVPRQLREMRLSIVVSAGLEAIARAHHTGIGLPLLPVPMPLVVADLVETSTAFLLAPAPHGAGSLEGA
jgi:AcrR family transcriptional regulator